MRQAIGVTAAVICAATVAHAQVLLSGGTYSQNFDALASSGTGNSWVNNSTLVGWYADRAGTNGPLTTYNAGTGSSTTGSLYSFGSSPADRALGSLASNTTGDMAYGVRLQNDTANLLQDFTISYTGEQWRNNNNASAQSLQLSFQISSSAITSADAANAPGAGGWTAFSGLDFTSPVHTGTGGGALDGNASANRTVFSSVLLPGVVLNPGDELFLRWFDLNDAGNDHALAVDNLNVSFTATPVPEPPEYAAMIGLALVGFAAVRRWSLRRT